MNVASCKYLSLYTCICSVYDMSARIICTKCPSLDSLDMQAFAYAVCVARRRKLYVKPRTVFVQGLMRVVSVEN
jgi:hypothetical protein